MKAGWLQKEKGIWTVTEAGIKAYKQFGDPETFYQEACRLYAVWKSQRDALAPDQTTSFNENDAEGAAENVGITFEEVQDNAWSQIEQFLKTSTPSNSSTSSPICSGAWAITWLGSRRQGRTEALIL